MEGCTLHVSIFTYFKVSCQEEINESDVKLVVYMKIDAIICCNINKFWLDECPKVDKKYIDGDLEDCKDLCKTISGCNAVNFDERNFLCGFRRCPSPIPQPTGQNSVARSCAIPYL